jgi:hypothetical protein
VGDPKYWGARTRGKGPDLRRDILAFAGSPIPDAYTLPVGWRRLPVNRMSLFHDVSTESVRLAQKDLAKSGMIERDPKAKRHDGGPRMDARIRITPKGIEALDALRWERANQEPS